MRDKYNYALDSIAEKYHTAGSVDMHIENTMQEFEWPWIHSHLVSNSHVLDLGYGDGVSLKNLLSDKKSLNLKITLLEGAAALVGEAQRVVQNDDTEIVLTFFEDFRRESTFDFIIASHVLEHVNEPDLLLDLLYENAKTGATLIGIVPNKDSIHRRLAVHMGLQKNSDDLSSRDRIVGHQRVYGTDTLTSLFENSKWKLESLKGFFLKPLSNMQMLDFSDSLLEAFFKVAEDLPVDLCANIGFIARKVEFDGK
jgi:2-polyprenyl-3-methyl-5-hydroxy-6-metoxy-1,4-benzoquinol methylase